MSRIGKMPIKIPSNVKVIFENNVLSVSSNNGSLTQKIHSNILIDINDNFINIKRANDQKITRELHGLTRALVNNMVIGVNTMFKKELEINGIGYRAMKKNDELIMNIGFSHTVNIKEIEGIKIDVENSNRIIVSGIDKQKVGQFAANIRAKKPPEPYKGKGIKYIDEVIRRKEGKTGSKKK